MVRPSPDWWVAITSRSKGHPIQKLPRERALVTSISSSESEKDGSPQTDCVQDFVVWFVAGHPKGRTQGTFHGWSHQAVHHSWLLCGLCNKKAGVSRYRTKVLCETERLQRLCDLSALQPYSCHSLIFSYKIAFSRVRCACLTSACNAPSLKAPRFVRTVLHAEQVCHLETVVPSLQKGYGQVFYDSHSNLGLWDVVAET